MTQDEHDLLFQFQAIWPDSRERLENVPEIVWQSVLANRWLAAEPRVRVVSLDNDNIPSPALYRLTAPQGVNALHEFEQQAKEKADQLDREDARQHIEDWRFTSAVRRDWWKFALGILLGWILGGITPGEVFSTIHGLFN